jgi:hypothetical protein
MVENCQVRLDKYRNNMIVDNTKNSISRKEEKPDEP